MQTEQKHHLNVYGIHIECLCVCVKRTKKMYTGKALMLILKIVSVAQKKSEIEKNTSITTKW